MNKKQKFHKSDIMQLMTSWPEEPVIVITGNSLQPGPIFTLWFQYWMKINLKTCTSYLRCSNYSGPWAFCQLQPAMLIASDISGL